MFNVGQFMFNVYLSKSYSGTRYVISLLFNGDKTLDNNRYVSYPKALYRYDSSISNK